MDINNGVGFPSSIENQLVGAIDTLTNSKLNKALADQTVIAQVIECLDEDIGKYKIRYQDATVDGYAVAPSVHFEDGSSVYVLMPQGRFDDRHIILWGEKTDAGYSRALPICMITINGDTNYTITTRKGTEYYSATLETPLIDNQSGEGGLA